MGSKKKQNGKPKTEERLVDAVEAACRAFNSPADADGLLKAAAALAAAVDALAAAQPAAPAAGDRGAARGALLAWGAERGVERHDRATLDAFGGSDQTAVVAAGAVAAGALVFAVPRRAMLVAAGGDAVGAFLETSGLGARNATVALALRVARERAAGAASPWRAYLDALPPTYDTPLFWTVAELAVLRPSPQLRRAVSGRVAGARVFCDVWRASQKGGPLHGELPGFTYAAWAWALGAVVTRQNAVPDAARPAAPPALALVPLWDMCNHDPDGGTSEFVLRPGGGAYLELRAARDVPEGAELRMRYGDRSAAELLIHSGFLPEGFVVEEIEIDVALPRGLDAKLAALLARLLDGARVPRSGPATWGGAVVRGAGGAAAPDAALAAALLAASADKADAAHLMRASTADHGAWTPRDAAHGARARDGLAALCEAALARRRAAPPPPDTRRGALAASFVAAEAALLARGAEDARLPPRPPTANP